MTAMGGPGRTRQANAPGTYNSYFDPIHFSSIFVSHTLSPFGF
jgi:hypothetical protein